MPLLHSCPRALRWKTALALRLQCAARVLELPCRVMVDVSLPMVLFMECGPEFLGPCTQVHGQGFPPPLGRRRGGGDAGSLFPGVLPPELICMHAVVWINTPLLSSCPHHNHHHHHHHNHHTGSTRLRSPFVCCFLCRVEAADLYGGRRRKDLHCKAEETAAPALVVATRVSERPHGAERSRPPQH